MQPEQHCSRLATFLNLPAEEPLIREAVANTRFEKLRSKEDEEGGFHERPEGCERFFRSGRSGEGREQLTGEQLQQFEEAFAATLHRFGYGVAASVQPLLGLSGDGRLPSQQPRLN